jgi:hypothetical protein
MGAPKEIMHVHSTTPSAHRRRQSFVSPTTSRHPAPVLSRSELRRIIAEMLG